MTINYSIKIERDVETVFNYFINTNNLKNWIGGLEKFEIISGEVGEIGAVSKQVIFQNGRRIKFEQTVTDFISNEYFEAKMTSKEMDMLIKYFFEENEEGHTIFTMSQEIKLKSFLFKTAKGLVKNLIENAQKKDFNQLKNILENSIK